MDAKKMLDEIAEKLVLNENQYDELKKYLADHIGEKIEEKN